VLTDSGTVPGGKRIRYPNVTLRDVHRGVPRRWKAGSNILSGSEPDAVASLRQHGAGLPRGLESAREYLRRRVSPTVAQDRAGLKAFPGSSPRSRSQRPRGENSVHADSIRGHAGSVSYRALDQAVWDSAGTFHLFFPPPSGLHPSLPPEVRGSSAPGNNCQVVRAGQESRGILFLPGTNRRGYAA